MANIESGAVASTRTSEVAKEEAALMLGRFCHHFALVHNAQVLNVLKPSRTEQRERGEGVLLEGEKTGGVIFDFCNPFLFFS